MVAMTMHFLGNKSVYKQLATQFDVTEDTFIRCTDYIINLLIEKSAELIRFPEKDDLQQIVNSFDQVGEWFPNAVGTTDSCHLAVHVKKNERGLYYNQWQIQDFLLGGCQPIGGVPTSDAYTFR